MYFAFTALALLLAPAFAVPAGFKTVEKHENKINGRYIVQLHANVNKDSHIADLSRMLGAGDAITHNWNATFLNGFAVKLNSRALSWLRAHPDVATISEDGIASIFDTQTNAPWGLQRISQSAKLSSTSTTALTYTYTYTATGSGVDVYVVDTGIYTAHSQFGGRARWGATFGSTATTDDNGHGTHVAGTVGGSQFGVAKAVNLIAVKVLDSSGSGAYSDIISGLNWVQSQASSSGRPSIATMSLGGSASSAVDNAVASLTNAGIHVTVAAGNSATNAANTSPARAPSAVTVGASTITDTIASYSNYGSVVDIFAPGTGITSSWIGSTTATNNISGTSMATPHVAGTIAYIISRDGNSSPANIASKLQSLATKNALSGIPSGTVNYLLYKGN